MNLMQIPGLGGILQARGLNQQAGQQELQQAQALMGILSQVQQQQQRQAALGEEQALRATVAESGGDLQKAMQGALSRGNIAAAARLAPLIEAQRKATMPPQGQAIGSGGLRLPDGTIVPPAARPDAKPAEKWSEPYNLNGVLVQKNEGTGQIRTAVTREPQVRVTQEAPVTPVTVQDPNNPRETLIIDGRTGRVLGKGPKMTEAGKIDAKADIAMSGLGADLQSAEDLLTGVVRTSDGQVIKGNLPTGSGVGKVYDAAAGLVGLSPSGAAEADQLKTVAARLVGRVPRFEGPQSDKDVQLYKEAAGRAGDESLPRDRRLAAIRQMRMIYAGYESGQRGRITGGRRGNDGATVLKFDSQGNLIQE